MTLTFIAVIFGFCAVMVAALAPLAGADPTDRGPARAAIDGDFLDDSSGLLRFVTEGERSRVDSAIREADSLDEELASDFAQAS